VATLRCDDLRLAAGTALATAQTLLGRGVDATTIARWTADLPGARARITREATQVGIVGHLEGDLAAGIEAVYESPLLRSNADAEGGRLLRIVHTDGEPELEEHTPDNAPWHWSTAHPDPVPPLRAQATGLQAERAALTEEDQSVSHEVSSREKTVSRLQQDVVNLSGSVGEAQRAADHAARHLEAEEARLARALKGLDGVRDRLPAVLADRPKDGVRAFSAAVMAPFHPNTLDELAKEEASVARARAAVAAARSVWEVADARVCDARARLAAHEQKLIEARRQLSHASKRRVTLRARAAQLSRKRLSLAQQMDDAAEARRSTLADDLAARLHGDTRGRLRLRWPRGGLGATLIVLVSPGTHSDDPVTRRAAEDALSTRADALVVAASIHAQPDSERVRVVRRMARQCPRVALLFYDAPALDTECQPLRKRARTSWADALGVPSESILAIAVPRPDDDTRSTGNPAEQLARREREALGQALLKGPPVARAAALAQAIRTTASRVDAEVRRIEQAHEQLSRQLESQRIDDPAAFASARRDALTRNLHPVAERARDATRSAVQAALQQARDRLIQEARGAPDTLTITALRDQLADRIELVWKDIDAIGRQAAARSQSRAIDQLMDVALAPLSERVRLTAQATRPPDSPPSLPEEENEACEAVLQQLREAIHTSDARSPAPAVLAGGAIGAALLGPLGALLGAGAGAYANKVNASVERRRAATIALVQKAFDQAAQPLEERAVAQLDGAEMALATAVDARLLPMLDRFMVWWEDQRDALRQRRARATDHVRRLVHVRDALVSQAVELDHAIAASTETAGVVAAPAYEASLPPLPPLLL
jgi:hypothetical protein